jgi:PAS domain S-box-containing protein
MLRDFVIGKDPIPSIKIYKQARLRGQLAMAMFAVGAVYIFIDLSYSLTRTIPIYIALLIISSISFWLNRQRHFRSSTLLILFCGNFIIYLLAASEPPTSGVYVFFFPAALSALALFSYTDWYWGLAMITFSFILFLTAYLVDYSLLPVLTYTTEYDQINFIINFTVALILSVFIIYFLINLNHHAERTLKQNEEQLIKTSEELKRSRERFEMAIKGTRAGMYEWYLKEKSVFVSPVWAEMLGYSMEEMAGITLDRLEAMTHPEDLEKTRQVIKRILTTGQPYNYELRLRTKSGAYKWFYNSGVSKRKPGGEIEIIVGSIIDVNERRLAEEQIREQNELLAKANTELDRFVYSVSHDLRAPLSSILGLISIAEKTESQPEVRSIMVMMRERVDALEKFIRDIIDYSRNSRMDIVQEPVNLNNLVQEIINGLKFTDEMGVVSIHINIPENYVIASDKLRLRIILNNLLSNALKYHDKAKPQSFVSVKVQSKNSHVRVLVEDNGLGIHPERLPRIFDMFYRASEAAKGSGLGLYIARETVKKMGGEISVQSAYGEGTTFLLEIPVISQGNRF